MVQCFIPLIQSWFRHRATPISGWWLTYPSENGSWDEIPNWMENNPFMFQSTNKWSVFRYFPWNEPSTHTERIRFHPQAHHDVRPRKPFWDQPTASWKLTTHTSPNMHKVLNANRPRSAAENAWRTYRIMRQATNASISGRRMTACHFSVEGTAWIGRPAPLQATVR